MRRPPRLASAMTPFPYAIDAAASAGDARAMMAEHAIHHLPVTASGAIAGIVTDRDLDGADGQAPVHALHTPHPYVVDLATPLEAVLRTMAERHLGSVIVTREGRLAGVLTWVDVCRAFAEHLARQFPAPGGDEAA